MKKNLLFSEATKSVKALSENEILKIIGGTPVPPVKKYDSIDVSSEDASGGTTTDTYE